MVNYMTQVFSVARLLKKKSGNLKIDLKVRKLEKITGFDTI